VLELLQAKSAAGSKHFIHVIEVSPLNWLSRDDRYPRRRALIAQRGARTAHAYDRVDYLEWPQPGAPRRKSALALRRAGSLSP
jgi:hypothetical protein